MNNLSVEIVENLYHKPVKMIIKAYDDGQSDPILNIEDILMALDVSIIHHHATDWGIYLTDEAGYRYSIDDDFEDDIMRLVQGEKEELEIYRDTEYLRPSDIINLGMSVKYRDTRSGMIMEYIGFCMSDSKLLFENAEGDIEDPFISITYDETEHIRKEIEVD